MIRIVPLKSASELLADASAPLLADEAKHSLLLGIAARLAEGGSYTNEQAIIANVYREDKLVLSVLRTPPFEMLVTECAPLEESECDEVVGALLRIDPDIPGITAERELAHRLARAHERSTGRNFEQLFAQRVFKLTELIPARSTKGSMRLPTLDEHPLVEKWGSQFAEEAMGGDAEHHRLGIRKKLENDEIYIWDDAGPVAMAGKGRPTVNSISIGYVFTPPQLRGKGYASNLVSELSRLLLRNHEFCTLFTDLANPTSNAIYTRLGYAPVCDFAQVRFQP